MAKKIGQFAVHLVDDQGELHSFLPGAEVPAWAEKRLGAHCFAGGEGEFDEVGNHPPGVSTVPASSGPPPRSGKGSGEEKWRAYAEQQGLDVTGIDTRDEIIDALEAEGVPVE